MKAKGKRRNQQRTEEKDNQESAVKSECFRKYQTSERKKDDEICSRTEKGRFVMLLNKKNDKETDKKSAR